VGVGGACGCHLGTGHEEGVVGTPAALWSPRQGGDEPDGLLALAGHGLAGELLTLGLLSRQCALQGGDIDNLSMFGVAFPSVPAQASSRLFMGAHGVTRRGPSGWARCNCSRQGCC